MSVIQQYLGREVHESWVPGRPAVKFCMVVPNLVGPQYGTFFILLFWSLKFQGQLHVDFWKYMHPSLRKAPSIMHECVSISLSVLLWGTRFLWGCFIHLIYLCNDYSTFNSS